MNSGWNLRPHNSHLQSFPLPANPRRRVGERIQELVSALCSECVHPSNSASTSLP